MRTQADSDLTYPTGTDGATSSSSTSAITPLNTRGTSEIQDKYLQLIQWRVFDGHAWTQCKRFYNDRFHPGELGISAQAIQKHVQRHGIAWYKEQALRPHWIVLNSAQRQELAQQGITQAQYQADTSIQPPGYDANRNPAAGTKRKRATRAAPAADEREDSDEDDFVVERKKRKTPTRARNQRSSRSRATPAKVDQEVHASNEEELDEDDGMARRNPSRRAKSQSLAPYSYIDRGCSPPVHVETAPRRLIVVLRLPSAALSRFLPTQETPAAQQNGTEEQVHLLAQLNVTRQQIDPPTQTAAPPADPGSPVPLHLKPGLVRTQHGLILRTAIVDMPAPHRPGLLGRIQIPFGVRETVGPDRFSYPHMADLMKYRTIRKYVSPTHPIRTSPHDLIEQPALFDFIWAAVKQEIASLKTREYTAVAALPREWKDAKWQKMLDLEIDILNALVELETNEGTTCRIKHVLMNEIFPRRGKLVDIQGNSQDKYWALRGVRDEWLYEEDEEAKKKSVDGDGIAENEDDAEEGGKVQGDGSGEDTEGDDDDDGKDDEEHTAEVPDEENEVEEDNNTDG